MRRTTYIFLLFFSIISCAKENTSNKNEAKNLKQNINAIINNWHKAAAEANYKNYFKSLDSASVFIGTDASENWNKKEFSEYSKPHFDKGKAWSFKTIERNIYSSKNNDVVWFDELLKTQMGICRGSGVLEKKGRNWKIKHYVLSVTIPNDNIPQIFNINKVKDSLYLSTNFPYSTTKQ